MMPKILICLFYESMKTMSSDSIQPGKRRLMSTLRKWTLQNYSLLEADSDDECADADDLELINSDPSEMPTEVETSLYGKIDIRSAETLLLNGGRTTFGAKERAKRFYSNPYTVSTSEMRDYHISLPCSCDSLLKKGDTVSLPLHDKKDGVRRAWGEVRFICTSNRVPLNHYCQEHFTKMGTINEWLLSGNKYYVRCTLS